MADEMITQSDKPNPVKSQSKWRSLGIFLTTFAFIVFIGAFAFGYFELAKINVYLAEHITQLQNNIRFSRADIVAIQKALAIQQQDFAKSRELSQQQEQLVAEWRSAQKGDLERWHLAEAYYLVKLANDHLQFTHNINLASILLDRANNILENLQNPSYLELRKSLVADIAKVKALPEIDVTQIYLRLTALDSQIDQLPFPLNPISAQGDKNSNSTVDQNAPWWKRGLVRSWDALRQIVVVRRTSNQSLPLVLPEEKTYLLQNLHAQVQQAIWGLLQRNATVYESSLTNLTSWLQKYTDTASPLTQNVLDNIQALQKINIQPPTMNLSETLKLFDNTYTQSEQQSDSGQSTPATEPLQTSPPSNQSLPTVQSDQQPNQTEQIGSQPTETMPTGQQPPLQSGQAPASQ